VTNSGANEPANDPMTENNLPGKASVVDLRSRLWVAGVLASIALVAPIALFLALKAPNDNPSLKHSPEVPQSADDLEKPLLEALTKDRNTLNTSKEEFARAVADFYRAHEATSIAYADKRAAWRRAMEAALTRSIGLNASNEELASALANRLRDARATYSRRRDLELGDSYEVELFIPGLGVGKTSWQPEEMAQFFEEGFKGEVGAAQLRIAKEFEAELTGPPDRFEITSKEEATKSLLSDYYTMDGNFYWWWNVRPLKPGTGLITLEVTSYIQDGQDRRPYPIRILQDKWEVQAHGLEWLDYEIRRLEPIPGFIAAGVVGVLAWFGRKRQNGRQKT
jgi:hypothetical protein